MSTPLLPLLIYVSAGLVRHGRSQQPSLADAIRYVAELTEIIEAAQNADAEPEPWENDADFWKG